MHQKALKSKHKVLKCATSPLHPTYSFSQPSSGLSQAPMSWHSTCGYFKIISTKQQQHNIPIWYYFRSPKVSEACSCSQRTGWMGGTIALGKGQPGHLGHLKWCLPARIWNLSWGRESIETMSESKKNTAVIPGDHMPCNCPVTLLGFTALRQPHFQLRLLTSGTTCCWLEADLRPELKCHYSPLAKFLVEPVFSKGSFLPWE